MGSLALQSLAMLMMDIHWPAKKLICCRVSKISHGHCTTQNFMVFTVHNQSSNMRFVLPMEWGHQAGNVRCNMIKNPGWESCSGQSLGEFLFIYIYVCVYVYSICMYVWFTCNPAPTNHFVDPSDPRLRTLPQPLELKQQLSFAGTWWKCLGFFPGKAGHKEFWKSLAVDNYQPVPG